MSDHKQSRVYLLRHGETEWSRSGQHTGRADLALTSAGRASAARLRPALENKTFALVLCSPLLRARETCELAGLIERAEFDDDLMEWDYGRYEGLTTSNIQAQTPGWNVFTDGSPDGESPADVAARVDRIIARVKGMSGPGDVAIFAHGHLLRVLAARWVGAPPLFGRHLLLDTGTICVLDYYHQETRAIRIWNAPPACLTAGHAPR